MSWHTGWMCSFDLETTSADPESARIVTATIVHIKGAQTEPHEWLVNPGVPIPAEASAIHGVTDERAKAEGVAPAGALREIYDQLTTAWAADHPVVIFNAPFDLTVLDRELRRHCDTSLDGAIGPVVDPFCIDKHLDKYRKGKRTLTATCQHYGVRLDAAHDATQDALAAARLAWRLAQVYREDLADLATLNALQAEWRANWAANYERFLVRQGTPAPIDGHWPLRPLAATA